MLDVGRGKEQPPVSQRILLFQSKATEDAQERKDGLGVEGRKGGREGGRRGADGAGWSGEGPGGGGGGGGGGGSCCWY